MRNRVRHELLPLLDDIAGRDVVPLLVRTADLLADDADARRRATPTASTRPTPGAVAAAPPAARPARRCAGWLATADGYPPDAATVGAGAGGRPGASAGPARSPAAAGSNVTASGCASSAARAH